MLPEEIREEIFAREDVQNLPIIIVFATIFAVEEAIESSGYEIVKKEEE